jgi:hypothetical protein
MSNDLNKIFANKFKEKLKSIALKTGAGYEDVVCRA